jgi:hypothetical protein
MTQKQAVLDRIGRLSQIGGITHFSHADGKAKGVSTLRVRTAAGLELWVVPDRGMDVFEASFRGQSLCWHSPTGIVHPSYFSSRGIEWLKTFAGGMLTTCGLSTVGSPSEDGGESLGLHGPIANTPAESVAWSEKWEGDDCLFTVSGTVREASVHGPNLVLERTILTTLHSASFALHDVVENQGLQDSPLMILYHFNFGFPLLTERSKIFSSSVGREAATPFAAATEEEWDRFGAPRRGVEERVYFHRMEADASGWVTVVLVSDVDRADFGVALRYDRATLPEFVQWKMNAPNHYVLGLEPGNCRSLGRAAERARGTLVTLAPGERREFRVEVTVLDGPVQVTAAVRGLR